jgi:hypothetical protein
MNRIPTYDAINPDSMLLWFAEMSARDLLFHPEDDPASIVEISSGNRIFTDAEADQVRDILEGMQSTHGEGMIDACYPVFMRAVGQRLDA